MNSKEALNKLKEIEKDYTFSKIGTCFHVNCDELQELVNKYQEIQNVYFKNEPMESADLNGEKLQELYNFTNKLLDKATPKKPLEEVKKEWEAKDYIWIETEFDIKLIAKNPTHYLKIRIFKNSKTYQGIINFEEHQLLTKTFRALGWYE